MSQESGFPKRTSFKIKLKDILGGSVVKNPSANEETWVQTLMQEDPTCSGATKPGSCNYWAYVLQLLKPEHPRTCAQQQEKPLQWEARIPQPEKSPRSNKDPVQPKIKIINK